MRRRILNRAIALVLGLAASPFLLGISAALAKDLSVGVAEDPFPLDLALSMRAQPTLILENTYETLIDHRVDKATGAESFVPMLARSWEHSPDEKSWTFHLVPHHRFDDGTEVTAGAVKFSFDRIQGLDRGPASAFAFIKKVTAVDRYTVRFDLLEPNALFLDALASSITAIINPAVMSHAVDGDFGSQWISSHTAGSGPYRLARFERGARYVLERNPYYWGTVGQINRVFVEIVRDNSVRALELKKGDLDIALQLPADALGTLERDPTIRIFSGPSNILSLVALNTESGVFANVAMRKAFADSIDYDGIIKGVFRGYAVRLRGPLPPEWPGAEPQLFTETYDPKLARVLAARNPQRLTQRAHIIYAPGWPEDDILAVLLQAWLGNLGVTARIERQSLASLIDRTQRGDYDALIFNWDTTFSDPAMILNFILDPSKKGPGSNYARYDAPHLQQLVDSSIVETDPAKRRRIIERVMRMVARDQPYIYIARRKAWVVARSDVHNLQFDPKDWLNIRFNDLQLSP